MAQKNEPEYQLRIVPYTDKRSNKEGFRFELSTIKEFRSFMYDILANISVDDETIRVEIHGLSAPHLTIPEHGPATYSEILYGLDGSYNLVVAKLNGAETTFTVQFSDRSIALSKKPKKSFVNILTSGEE